MKTMKLITALCAGCVIAADSGYPLPETALHASVTAQAAQTTEWSLDAEGTLTVSGTGAMDDFDSIDQIPWYASRQRIRTVLIGRGVTAVGKNALSGDVTLPERVRYLSADAVRNLRKH